MEYPDKEIWYDEYCRKCKHTKLEEDDEPCCDCLSSNIGFWTPLFFLGRLRLIRNFFYLYNRRCLL